MGIPDHLTCLLRNLYAGQEVTVRTGHGTTDWFQTGKRVSQGSILSPCLFIYVNIRQKYFKSRNMYKVGSLCTDERNCSLGRYKNKYTINKL